MNRTRLAASIVGLILLGVTSTALAIGDDKYSRPSLKGVKKLIVAVQIENPVSDDFKKAGLAIPNKKGPVYLLLGWGFLVGYKKDIRSHELV